MNCSKCFTELFKPWVSMPNFVLLCAFMYVVVYYKPGNVAAAWVQAIGSVVAIFVAIGIARQQHNAALKRREVEIREDERALACRLKFIASEITHISKAVLVDELHKKGKASDSMLSSLRRLECRLDVLDVDINETRLNLAFQLRTRLRELIHFVEHYKILDNAYESVKFLQSEIVDLEAECEQHFRSLSIASSD